MIAAALLGGLLLAPAAQVVVPEDAAEALERRRTGADRYEELGDALARLERDYPGLCRTLEIGESAGGRPIWACVLGASNDAPAVLVLPSLDVEPVVGASAALDLLVQVAEAESESEGPTHLAHSSLVVVPAPDPDGWFADDRPRSRALDRNFPVRWDPWPGAGASPGPVPSLGARVARPSRVPAGTSEHLRGGPLAGRPAGGRPGPRTARGHRGRREPRGFPR